MAYLKQMHIIGLQFYDSTEFRENYICTLVPSSTTGALSPLECSHVNILQAQDRLPAYTGVLPRYSKNLLLHEFVKHSIGKDNLWNDINLFYRTIYALVTGHQGMHRLQISMKEIECSLFMRHTAPRKIHVCIKSKYTDSQTAFCNSEVEALEHTIIPYSTFPIKTWL